MNYKKWYDKITLRGKKGTILGYAVSFMLATTLVVFVVAFGMFVDLVAVKFFNGNFFEAVVALSAVMSGIVCLVKQRIQKK